MQWGKFALVTLILAIIFSIGIFANFAGYRVNGVPHGNRPSFHTIGIAENTGDPDTTIYVVFFDDGTSAEMTMSEIQDMIHNNPLSDIFGFFVALGSFQVDDIPYFITVIFYIIIVLIALLIWTTFVPFFNQPG